MLKNVKLNYPEARAWMWSYCVYLGHFEDGSNKYDLGVYVHSDGKLSAAIVYGNEPGDYYSGREDIVFLDLPQYKEAFKRAHLIGL